MPQWAGSCWYYLRFADPHNDRGASSIPSEERYWMPVDLYVGGAEHAVLHLLYARFWHKVLYDLGLVHTKEPFQRLVNQGMILAPLLPRRGERALPRPPTRSSRATASPSSGPPAKPAYSVVEKMSKSKKNVINPDDIVAEHGADTLRLYILFMGPPEADKLWDRADIEGVRRFLHRAWRLVVGDERHARPAAHGRARRRRRAPRAAHRRSLA